MDSRSLSQYSAGTSGRSAAVIWLRNCRGPQPCRHATGRREKSSQSLRVLLRETSCAVAYVKVSTLRRQQSPSLTACAKTLRVRQRSIVGRSNLGQAAGLPSATRSLAAQDDDLQYSGDDNSLASAQRRSVPAPPHYAIQLGDGIVVHVPTPRALPPGATRLPEGRPFHPAYGTPLPPTVTMTSSSAIATTTSKPTRTAHGAAESSNPAEIGLHLAGTHTAADPASAADSLEAAKQLTRRLRVASTWRQVRQMLAAAAAGGAGGDGSSGGRGPSLDEIHLATAARRLRDVAPEPGRRLARERAKFRGFVTGFTELCRHHLASMTPAPLVGILYALAALRCPPPAAWMTAWLRSASGQLQHFGPQELANTAYALGQLQYDPGDLWLLRLCELAAGIMLGPAVAAEDSEAGTAASDWAEAEVDGAAASEWGDGGSASTAASRQEVAPVPWEDERVRRECDDQAALAAWSVRQPGGADRAADAVGAGPRLRPAGTVAATALTAAVPTEPPERAHSACSLGPQHQPASSPSFSSHGLSQLLWGLARLGFLPPESIMATFCSEALRQLPYFTAQGLSNTLWSLATLGYRPPDPWVSQGASACLRLLPSCNAFDLSVSLWALLRMGYTPDGEWLAGYLSASFRQLPSASPEQSARILWSLAKVGVTPPADWIRRWLSMSYVRLLEAEPTSLTSIVWAFATLGIRPSRKWMDMLMVAAWEQPLRAFPPAELVMLMWGLAHCRSLPEPAWMDEFWLVSYKRLRQLSPRHLSLLLWSCVTLGQAPSPQWLSGYEQVTLACMNQLSAEGISLIVYSYGILETTPSHEWLLALYDTCAVRNFEGFNALSLERLIWGIAKVAPPEDARPDAVPGWTAVFLEHCAVHLNDASYCNLSNTLFALAMLGVQPGEAWLSAALSRVEALYEDGGHATAAKVLWALPRMAAGPTPELETQIARVQRLLQAWRRRVLMAIEGIRSTKAGSGRSQGTRRGRGLVRGGPGWQA